MHYHLEAVGVGMPSVKLRMMKSDTAVKFSLSALKHISESDRLPYTWMGQDVPDSYTNVPRT
jgi:hypothetical protein